MLRLSMFTGLWFTLLLASPATAETVMMTNGEILKGNVISRTENQITLDHAVFGQLTIPVDQISIIITQDQINLVREQVEAEVTPTSPTSVAKIVTVEKSGTAPSDLQEEATQNENENAWKTKLELGFSGTQGNSQTLTLYSAINSSRKTPNEHTRLKMSYFLTEKKSQRTRNELTAGVIQDWLKPGTKLFYFAGGQYEFDEFASWDHRLSGSGGLGYQWIDNERFKFASRLGGGGAKEFGSENNDARPEALIGNELAWQITDTVEVAGRTLLYPDLSDSNKYRIDNAIDWLWDLTNHKTVQLKLGLKHEYESDVDHDKDHNDYKFFGALIFKF